MSHPSQKSKRQSLSTLLDFFRNKSTQNLSNDLQSTRISRNRSTQGLPGESSDLHSTTDITLDSTPTTSQKAFKKSDDAQHDITVLALTYVLQDNSTIQELIRLIISLNNRSGGELSEVVALSVRFTIQLASFHEKDSAKALAAMTAFLSTMQNIDGITRGPTENMDNMNNIVNSSIAHIKNTYPILDDHDHDRNVGSDKGLSGILDTILGTTSTILNIFNEASVIIPVPFVKPLVASVASLLTAVQQTRSNLDGLRQVATVAGEFVVMLAVACAEDKIKPSRPFQQALDRFEKKLHDIARQCTELSRRNVLWRFFQQGVDQNSLLVIKQDLQNAVVQFQTEAQLLHHLDLRSLGQVINDKLDEDAVDALPKPHSYFGRRDEYLLGSRSDVIQDIANWLEDPNQLIFWMRGGAGLGKSTLAHELVDSLQDDGRLATFAFLLRGSSTDPATIIQIMARELAALHPRAIPEVAAASRTCKGSHRPLREYMESYIIKPICSLSYPYFLVIIVDGLDEWEHHEMFLKELENIAPSSSLKILLFSRPNYSVERSLLNVAVQKYELPPVSQVIMEQYFNHHFVKIDWEMRKPSSFTISHLVRLADGLLIWAAMVCSFLSHKMRAGAAHELLDQILLSGKQIALNGQLSNLYHDALKQLFRDDMDQKLFRRVFGAMTILREPLPLHDFSRLLGISHYQVQGVLSQLSALQTRGTLDEPIVPLASQCFHSSFVEFTMNEEGEEAGHPLLPYLINPRSVHQFIAEGCLSFFNDFLLSFRGSRCGHSDLRGLELYAVKFWPLHVASSNDRMTPLPAKLENLLLELPENLRRWASLFLAINLPASSQDWDQVVGSIDKDGFYCSLADFLENENPMDTTLTSHRTFCLEVSVRLEPQLEKAWEDLGESYLTRFDSNGTLDLLNNAIVVQRHAVQLCSEDVRHVTAMSNLASGLSSRFRQTGSMADLEEAISINRQLLSQLPTSHPRHARLLNDLGVHLRDRFSRTSSMTDLEDAVSMQRESLSLCPTGHPDRSLSLTNLGLALWDRFGRTGSMADLEEAILTLRESPSLGPTPHSLRSSSLNSLANALLSRFEKTRSMTDLDEATLMYRESLSFHASPHPLRSESLRNLGIALLFRFRKTGSTMALEEAILMHRESLSLRPLPHPLRPESLNTLACALYGRFTKIGESMTDLEEAISMFREALSLCPISHPNRVLFLENLVFALETRSNKNGNKCDLDEALSLRQEVLALQSQ